MKQLGVVHQIMVPLCDSKFMTLSPLSWHLNLPYENTYMKLNRRLQNVMPQIIANLQVSQEHKLFRLNSSSDIHNHICQRNELRDASRLPQCATVLMRQGEMWTWCRIALENSHMFVEFAWK